KSAGTTTSMHQSLGKYALVGADNRSSISPMVSKLSGLRSLSGRSARISKKKEEKTKRPKKSMASRVRLACNKLVTNSAISVAMAVGSATKGSKTAAKNA